MILNEVFESYLNKYLESKGLSLYDGCLNERSMDEAFCNASYILSDATVQFHENSSKRVDYIEELCGKPVTHSNEGDREIIVTYTKKVEETTGLEYYDAKSRTWSISGGLSAKYQGVGASASIGYTRSQTESVRRSNTTVLTREAQCPVPISGRQKRKVQVKNTYSVYEHEVESVSLKFPKDAQIQCRVVDSQPTATMYCPWSWCPQLCRSNQFFYLSEIFTGNTEECPNGKDLIAKINGKYLWVETDIFWDIKKEEPL